MSVLIIDLVNKYVWYHKLQGNKKKPVADLNGKKSEKMYFWSFNGKTEMCLKFRYVSIIIAIILRHQNSTSFSSCVKH